MSQYRHRFDLRVKQRWKLVSKRLFSSSKRENWTNRQRRDHWWNDQHHMPRFWPCQDYQNVGFYPIEFSQYLVTIQRLETDFSIMGLTWRVWFKVIIILIFFSFFLFMGLKSYKIITMIDYKSLTFSKVLDFIILYRNRSRWRHVK